MNSTASSSFGRKRGLSWGTPWGVAGAMVAVVAAALLWFMLHQRAKRAAAA